MTQPFHPTTPVAGGYGWPAVLPPPARGDRLLNRLLTTPYLVMFLAGHIALALAMGTSPMVSTAHAAAVLMVGSYWAMQGKEIRVAAAGGYIAGSEILWRMTGAATPWEYGKYALVLVLAMGMVRKRRIAVPVLALVYLVLLLPSTPLAFGVMGLEQTRQEISFNLSGPVALLAVAGYFHQLRIGLVDLKVILISLFAPILGVGAIAVSATMTADQLSFVGASNLVTSGGFGPNQVASMLGLGIVVGFLYAVFTHRRPLQRWLMVALILVLAAQAGLTFSRSGLALASVSTAMAALFLLRNPRARLAFLGMGVVILLFVQYAMIPFLNDFTQGAFGLRFTDTSSTGRVQFAAYDLTIWQDNLLLGVGPGQATQLRSELGQAAAAHTEFTRVLSEHGFLGALSMIALLVLLGINFLQARGPLNKGVVAAMATWGVVFMALNAFRVAAPAFTLGMTCAVFALDRPEGVPWRGPLPTRTARVPVGGR